MLQLLALGFQHAAVICPYLVMVALVAGAAKLPHDAARDAMGLAMIAVGFLTILRRGDYRRRYRARKNRSWGALRGGDRTQPSHWEDVRDRVLCARYNDRALCVGQRTSEASLRVSWDSCRLRNVGVVGGVS